MSQLKPGNIRAIFPNSCVAKNIWRVINTIASIWLKNVLRFLSLNIISSWKLTVLLELHCPKTVRFLEQIVSADRYPSTLSRQMEAIVCTCTYISVQLLCLRRRRNHSKTHVRTDNIWQHIGAYSDYSQTWWFFFGEEFRNVAAQYSNIDI